jgi:transposase-like protein
VPAPKKYPDELRERAIRFALDLVDGPEKLSVNAASKRVGEQLGIVPDSLRNCVLQARIDAGDKPGLTRDEQPHPPSVPAPPPHPGLPKIRGPARPQRPTTTPTATDVLALG